MLVEVVKSKIHRATVTQADLNYMGSITLDEALMEAADILENERVYIVNNNNGERFDTYVIKGERGSGVVCLNGAAARKVQPGDVVIIMAYTWMEREEAKIVFLIRHNAASACRSTFLITMFNREEKLSFRIPRTWRGESVGELFEVKLKLPDGWREVTRLNVAMETER